ncbi:MAG: tyrosine-type recombinase/integrase, partial [Acidimicrobiia bacterium]
MAGSAALVLAEGVRPLRPEAALFEAMLEGWGRQHAARRLSAGVLRMRVGVVRRFQAFAGKWPWEWSAAEVDAWVAESRWSHSTTRAYQASLALFLDFLCDPRYGWREACAERVGVAPVQVLGEWNRVRHVADYEGRPERRPLTRAELQVLFDTADGAVAEAAASPRKGWLAAFRDATLIKVV